MAISIYKLFQLTYSDYIRDYPFCLTDFLNDYEDNTELYFIKEQKLMMDSHLAKYNEVVTNLVEEDNNKEEMLDLFRNRINTAYRIYDFLEQRKQEIEKASKTVPAPKNVNGEKITVDQSDKLLKNPYITIFKNDFAYTLFEKMKECYSDSNTKQADYSNLFDIMQNEKLVICSGVDFIILLSNYDINITKIDSARTGNKKKTILYNSIKENLLKKHGLSTV